MLRKIVLGLVVGVAIAGCGSSSPSGSHATAPLATELSYFPSNSPFILTITTNSHSSGLQSAQSSLLGRFPEATLGIDALEQKLQSVGINYDTDIKPLFGNPIMLGAGGTSFSTSASSGDFLFSWVTSSASELKSLVAKIFHGGSVGTRDGASLFFTPDSGGMWRIWMRDRKVERVAKS